MNSGSSYCHNPPRVSASDERECKRGVVVITEYHADDAAAGNNHLDRGDIKGDGDASTADNRTGINDAIPMLKGYFSRQPSKINLISED